MNLKTSLSVAAVTALLLTGAAGTAHAGGNDSDRDGIPNRWERTHGMNPSRAADAKADYDRDRLTNLGEYRAGSLLRDEDTDNDGADDGDEVHDGLRSTHVRDSDTDGDSVRDGDEDGDGDGIDNEDEDDALEVCAADDDDRDRDAVTDEDENDFGLRVGVADSDDDGTLDGDEDFDDDGEANEDDDDALDDSCDGDRDGNGEDDEDEGDLFGTITSFDEATGTLVVTGVGGSVVTGVVTGDTEIEFEDVDDSSDDSGGDDSGSDDSDERVGTTADLTPGVQVAELEFEDDEEPVPGALEEVEIYQTPLA